MGDTIRLLPFTELLERIAEEYRKEQSIFAIPADAWYRPRGSRRVDICADRCATPVGPAAGPHTQLAGNIVAAYLTGGRFFELKTVQILDALEIERPCIDAADEGYNTEWSTELTLDEAWAEYAKGWILLHALERLLDSEAGERGFAFNMSVGYDLEGITSEPVKRFISRMTDCREEPRFQGWLSEIRRAAPLFAGTDLEGAASALETLAVSAEICSSVTLSTMHGCPPDEIEAICRHMLTEEKLNTAVKLNPTLLGQQRVRSILDGLGYDYIEVKGESFDQDLTYPQAVGIISRLRGVAAEHRLTFGVKLSNTLPVRNSNSPLPGEEAYLSGRPLYPLTVTLAATLAAEFDGELPISFSGGVNAYNVAALFEAGVRPITVTTELLKPGGYLRQRQLALECDAVGQWNRERVDVEALESVAAEARTAQTGSKAFRGNDRVRNPGPLPLYDCYVAPCVTACPIGQDVPEYIRLAGSHRYAEALELIYETNALPSVTGHVCAHPCQSVCSRLDYEGCISIREIKRLAVAEGGASSTPTPRRRRTERVAVVGGGPAGLSAAYFLAREGFAVRLFERSAGAPDTLGNLTPHFGVAGRVLAADLEAIEALGVTFAFLEAQPAATGILDGGYDALLLDLTRFEPRPRGRGASGGEAAAAGEGAGAAGEAGAQGAGEASASAGVGAGRAATGAPDRSLAEALASQLPEHGEVDGETVYRAGADGVVRTMVVECIAEGRRAAEEIIRRYEADYEPSYARGARLPRFDAGLREAELLEKKALLYTPAKRAAGKAREERDEFASRELGRCLECSFVCNKCVEVCPNRANLAVGGQILHLDALCNECGNCGHFCPWDGRPYTDKPTIFSTLWDFRESGNPGWLVAGERSWMRLGGVEQAGSLVDGRIELDAPTGSPEERRFLELFSKLYAERPALFGAVEPTSRAPATPGESG